MTRGKSISSSELLLRNEINYIRNIKRVKHFSLKVVDNIIVATSTTRNKKTQSKETQQSLQPMVPYFENQGHKLLPKMKKQLK